MSAIGLFHEDGKLAGVWYCSECRSVYLHQSQAQACHGNVLCACGNKIPKHRSYQQLCDACNKRVWDERIKQEELARFDTAEKISAKDWDGPVFADGVGPEWFESVEDLLQHCEDDESEPPEYVWAGKDIGVPKADASDLTERLTNSIWDDADESDLNGVAELYAAVEAFNKENESVAVWNADYAKAIVLSREVGRA